MELNMTRKILVFYIPSLQSSLHFAFFFGTKHPQRRRLISGYFRINNNNPTSNDEDQLRPKWQGKFIGEIATYHDRVPPLIEVPPRGFRSIKMGA